MFNTERLGAFWGSLTAASIGVSDLFGRRVVEASTALNAAAVMQFFALLTSLASIGLIDSVFVSSEFGIGALSGLGIGVGLSCYYQGLHTSSATVVAPLVGTLSAVIPFAYAVVRGSDTPPLAIAAAGLAFVGLAIISAGGTETRRVRSGLKWGTISGLGYGFGLSIVIDVSDQAGSWPAVSQRMAAFAMLTAVAGRTASGLTLPTGQPRNAVIGGVFAGLSTVFYLLGIEADAPPAVVTASMFPAASVAIGYLYYRDPVSRLQILGIAIVLAGVSGVVLA